MDVLPWRVPSLRPRGASLDRRVASGAYRGGVCCGNLDGPQTTVLSAARAGVAAENDAFDVLIGATATTMPGLLAKLTYLREIGEGKEAWMIRDREERVALPLIKSLETSIEAIVQVR